MAELKRSLGILDQRLPPRGVAATQPPRATQVAYDRLRNEIMTLALPPGMLVNERELCARLGVTRLTMIPALHRLAESGLVSILSRRGILISPIDVLDVQQVFDARQALEGKAAELAAARASAADCDVLWKLEHALEAETELTNDFRVFLDRDLELHTALARLAGNRFIAEELDRVWMVSLRLWHLFFRKTNRPDIFHVSHEPIVVAIQNQDSAAAREAMLQHLAASKDLLMPGLWGSQSR